MGGLIRKIQGDVGESWQWGFQDSSSPLMEEIIGLHDQVMYIVVVIIGLIVWLIVKAVVGKRYNRYLVEGTTIEIVWTIIPAIVLILVAFPSLRLLYIIDEVVDVGVTIKAIGHQWYWAYEYSDYKGKIVYDSYMVATGDLPEGGLRLLEVDNRVVLPINTPIRVMVTAADVIHSFAVPSLGVKMDGIPGRLNQINIYIRRPGVYYGQCSEICGANHSFMPIVVEGVLMDKYIEWIRGNKE